MNNETTTQKLAKMANGGGQAQEQSILQKLLALLFSPGVQDIAAGNDVNEVLQQRQMMMGARPAGGAFDLIYKAKKDREDAMRALLNQ